MTEKRLAMDSDLAWKRSAGYSLLAYALAYPDDAILESLHVAAREAALVLAGTPLSGLARAAATVTRADLEPAYVRLCTLSSSPDCPTYETAYFSPDPQQQTLRMADIAGFYRAFGVDATDTGFRPDDMPVELEFMAFLCRKQAHAVHHLGAPRAGQTFRAQRTFLADHLGRWAGGLGRRFATGVPAGHFYQMAGLALAEWVADDCRLLGARPEEVSGLPVESLAPETSHGPEFEGPGSAIFSFDEIPVA
ncbi:MAG: hypothetical protein C0506_13760 [Anaerolinea sp.]|nr:hypothetical protein [Anaerolinea sp.]